MGKKSEVCLQLNDSERFFSTDTKQRLIKITPQPLFLLFSNISKLNLFDFNGRYTLKLLLKESQSIIVRTQRLQGY